jgi:DHA2 family lincomycin resistance protein-like MFS transporter
LISTFVVILNERIMGVALPRPIITLRTTASAAQWLTNAFMFPLLLTRS